MTKPSTYTLELYRATLHVAVDDHGWELCRQDNPGLADYSRGAPAGSTTFSLWLPAKRGPSSPHMWVYVDVAGHDDALEMVNTAAHEATHAGMDLLEHIEHHGRGAGGDEPTAYLIGWLTMHIMAACGPKWRRLRRT